MKKLILLLTLMLSINMVAQEVSIIEENALIGKVNGASVIKDGSSYILVYNDHSYRNVDFYKTIQFTEDEYSFFSSVIDAGFDKVTKVVEVKFDDKVIRLEYVKRCGKSYLSIGTKGSFTRFYSRDNIEKLFN